MKFKIISQTLINDVSHQIKNIVHSFPQPNGLSKEYVARICLEKEVTIVQLQRSLKDAQYMIMDKTQKISFLKCASMTLIVFQYQDDDKISIEKNVLSKLMSDKINMVMMIERKNSNFYFIK